MSLCAHSLGREMHPSVFWGHKHCLFYDTIILPASYLKAFPTTWERKKPQSAERADVSEQIKETKFQKFT